MAPVVGRIALTIGVFLVTLSLIPLPFLPVGSAEFVVDVLALIMSSTFLALVVWSVRRAARFPMPDDVSPAGQQRDVPPDE